MSVKCRVACSFDVDLGAIKDALMNPLVCVPDLPAIIKCGAGTVHHWWMIKSTILYMVLDVCVQEVKKVK